MEKHWMKQERKLKRALELTEFACSLPQLISGELLEVSKGVECRVEYKPLGCGCIYCSLIFQTWFRTGQFQIAIALGNA